MNKKIKAFTLGEVIIAMTLVSVIAVIVLSSFSHENLIEQRRITALSRKFNSAIENAYQKIVFENTRNATIQTLIDEDRMDGGSDVLRDYFVKYLEGENYPPKNAEVGDGEAAQPSDTEDGDESNTEGNDENEEKQVEANCEELNVANESPVSEYKEKAVCAMFSPDIIAGFYLNKECNETILANPYFIKNEESNEEDNTVNPNTKEIENTCGYVIYSFRKSKGIFGQDMFVIPLGKRNVK